MDERVKIYEYNGVPLVRIAEPNTVFMQGRPINFITCTVQDATRLHAELGIVLQRHATETQTPAGECSRTNRT